MVEGQAPVLEQPGQDPVDDGRADLALDVVADDGHAGGVEPAGPLGVGGDEHRDGVDEAHPGLEAGLGVEPLGLLGADRQVADQHVGAATSRSDGDHVDRLGRRLLDGLAVVLAEPVEGRAPLHGDPELADAGEADGVVLPGEDGLAQVGADLGRVDVEGGHELEVADVVATEHHVHQAGDRLGRIGVAVVLDALDERAGAVAHAGDGDSDGAHELVPFVVVHVRSPLGARDSRIGVLRCFCRSSSMRRSSQAMSCSVASVLCSTRERV